MADEKERPELKVVTNWKEINLEGEALQQDLTEDAWEFGAPPPRGVYELKCFNQKDGIQMGLEDPKDPKSVYFVVAIEGRITGSKDGEYDDIPAFSRVDTRIFRGKSISKAAGLLVKLGYKVENPITPKKLAMMVQAALKKEPIIKAELDWRGSYQYTDSKGNKAYENVYNHFEEFPDNPEKPGTKKHIVSVNNSHSGGVAEVRAQLQVVRFFGKTDKIPVFGSGAQLVSAPKSAQPIVQPQLVNEPQFIAPQTAGVQPSASTDEEDMALLLQE